jgi:hypothetical protein
MFFDCAYAMAATRFSGSVAPVIADSGIAVHRAGLPPGGNSGGKPTAAINTAWKVAKIIATVSGNTVNDACRGAGPAGHWHQKT